jgi:hypothetical protein
MMTEAMTEVFHAWMRGNNWEFAVDTCPVDGGEYLFATDSIDVWSEFVVAHPECGDDSLRKYVHDSGPYGRADWRDPEDRDEQTDPIRTLAKMIPGITHSGSSIRTECPGCGRKIPKVAADKAMLRNTKLDCRACGTGFYIYYEAK